MADAVVALWQLRRERMPVAVMDDEPRMAFVAVAGAEVAGAMEDASGNRWQGSFPAGAHGSGGWEAGNQARCPGLRRDSWEVGQIPVLLARMNGNGVGMNRHGGGLNGNGGSLNGHGGSLNGHGGGLNGVMAG